jgi:cyclopropane fatty-acyl-phospholipid synthase-like methyltransferase
MSTPPVQGLNAESLFDSVGPAYESAFADCTPQQASLGWLLAYLPAGRQCSILDIGCGTGRPVCSTLAAAGHTVTGIDVSAVMIAAATRNVPAASFVKVDVRDFEPAGARYDAITVYFSLIASVSREDIRTCIGRVYDWLTPGGFFVFATVPIAGEGLEIAWMGRPIVASGLSEAEVLDRMRDVGFEILSVEMSQYRPKAVEAGICKEEDVWEENHLFVYARKGYQQV